jgi:hypothetical protein
MGKYIIDKTKDKRIDIELGGHWENLMEYIKKEYPQFYAWSDKEKDNWILENFEFKETKTERVNYLNRGYVREFSDGGKGYKLNTTLRDKEDKKELDNLLETIATKTSSCFENLYAFLYDIEKVMRKRNLEAYCTEIDVVLVSFSLSNGRFSASFSSLYDESRPKFATFTRNSINEPLIPDIYFNDFFIYFSGVLSYHKDFWEREKEAVLEWVKTLEE